MNSPSVLAATERRLMDAINTITELRAELAAAQATIARQTPLRAAATALADCHAWIERATTEAEEDQACGAFDAAAEVIIAQVAQLRGEQSATFPATSLPSLLAAAGYPATGAWALAQAAVAVEYEQPDADDPIGLPDARMLDLRGFDRVIVLAIDGDGTPLTAGLATLIPLAGYCRVCGCSAENACLDERDEPCHWVEADLCSRCAGRA